MKLDEIASIFSGHNFREAIKSSTAGNGYVLQMSNVDRGLPVNWRSTNKTTIEWKRGEPAWLVDNDVIFLVRGQENFALHLTEVPESTVCTSHFFVIRVHDKRYLPSFIAWQLNQPTLQEYFRTERGDTKPAPPIKVDALRNADIQFTDIKLQKEIARLDSLIMQEQRLYSALLKNRQKQMRLLSNQILSDA